MKIAPVALIAVLLGGQLNANLIPLWETRSVSASGVAGAQGESYSYSQNSSGAFGGFSGNVAGSADWTDAGGSRQSGSYQADSAAIQTWSITA